MTTYTELNATLVRRTGLRGFDFTHAEGRAAMGHLLFLIVQDYAADEARIAPGRPRAMLSALVCYLNANNAGPGFYALAQERELLGRGASALAREKFWLDQLQELYARHGRRRGVGAGAGRGAPVG
ncbi:hypothetical protein EIZ62_25830 [Streptomyces ficellus]|uniref:Uncharacterized protein n=1 Tax=Streptomyces ficellus TaxID=1977088 RepID=A0A6I6FHL5_9ACTN|nr:hypothetical protein EIZ62_25830 [Streptomyces ficellus]